jgi:hypothetical protein
MWTIGYDQVLDEPPSSPTLKSLTDDRNCVPSISQPSPIKLPSNTGQLSLDSDAESDDGEGKSPDTSDRAQISSNTDRSFDDNGETNGNKELANTVSAPLLNSPTGSDKFIMVTDVEILEAKGGTHSDTLVKSSYLDLKEGEQRRFSNAFTCSLFMFKVSNGTDG